MVLNKRFFYYEDPNSGRETRIYFYQIEDIAREKGDNRDAEDMPDDYFYRYVEIIMDKD
jgi:hypothetical protein